MSDFSRKIPQQRRAQTSRACILEATAQLLDRRVVGSITTNHVAERAGVSIGTLYRYFRDKDEIFDALARSEMKRITESGIFTMNSEDITIGSELVNELAEIAVSVFNGRLRVRKNLHEIIGRKSPIAREIYLRRVTFSMVIGRKLVQLEPERFRVLQREERRCLVMAWGAIINETLAEDVSRYRREHVKKLLAGTVLSFSEKDQ